MHLSQAAAKDGEILREDIDQTPVDGTPAGDHTIAQVFLLVQTEVCGTVLHEEIDLAERAFVHEQVDALTGGQSSALVLRLDTLSAAAKAAFSFPIAQLAHLGVNISHSILPEK